MQSHRAASRYAKSLLELAQEKNILDKVHADMQLFSAVAEQNRVFAVMLRNPIINHDKKRNVLRALFGKRMQELTLLSFDLITKKNRENILEQVAKEFQIQYNNLMGLQVAEISTSIELDDKLRNSFNDLVKDISGKKADLQEVVDEDLVGGFVLKVGDYRLDQSIKTQLQNIKKELTKK
jgi:F-type H+-transporting ATPase subunit delta